MSVDDACGCSRLSHFELLETVGTPAIAECLSNTLRDLFCFAHDPDSRPTLYLRGRRHSSEISPRSVPDKRCQLRRSTQHFVEVYSLEFGILKFFLDADLTAAPLGPDPLAYSRTGQFS